jgi:hypothetical protein
MRDKAEGIKEEWNVDQKLKKKETSQGWTCNMDYQYELEGSN